MLSRPALSSRRYWVVAWALVAVAVVLHTVVLAQGSFYTDDLVLIGHYQHCGLSSTCLFWNHHGHLMPGAFLLSGLATRLAPLQWWLPALQLGLLHLLAVLATLRMVTVMGGKRWLSLAALGVVLLSPVALPSTVWWSAGLTFLPLWAGLAWTAADTVLLCRSTDVDRRQLLMVRIILVYLFTLFFYEKAVLIVLVVALIAMGWVVLPTSHHQWVTEITEQVRRGRPLLAGLVITSFLWMIVYFSSLRETPPAHEFAQVPSLLGRTLTHGVVPGVLGGPWRWEKPLPGEPGLPWAHPPLALLIVSAVVVAAIIAVTLLWRSRSWLLWTVFVLVVVAEQLPILLARSSADTAPQVVQSFRYMPEVGVLFGIAMLMFPLLTHVEPSRARNYTRFRETLLAWHEKLPAAVAMLSTVVVVGSLASTVTFNQVWRQNPTGQYLANAVRTLSAHPGRLQPQPLAEHILSSVEYPNNLTSRVFGVLPQHPVFSMWTTTPALLDEQGVLRPALLQPVQQLQGLPVQPAAGSPTGASAGTFAGSPAGPRCLAAPVTGVSHPFTGPLVYSTWDVELHYTASIAGTIAVSFDRGERVRVPVQAGTHTVWFRMVGAGRQMTVRLLNSAMVFCLNGAQVGSLALPSQM